MEKPITITFTPSLELRNYVAEVLRQTEANQAPPESDSTACCPAGCGDVEHVTAGRCPDRERLAKIKTLIETEVQGVFESCQYAHARHMVELLGNRIFKQICTMEPGGASG